MKAWTQREIWAYLDRVEPALDRLDHFSILDIPVTANEREIQRAFHNMAAGLHPDRHRQDLSPEQHERLIVVYARIAEAYRVLRSHDTRKKYCQELAKKTKGDGTTASPTSNQDSLAMLSPAAQKLYRRALAAKRTGDLASAMLNMKMALAKHPQSSFLKEALRSVRGK